MYIGIWVLRDLKEELTQATDIQLQVISNAILFKTAIPLRIQRLKLNNNYINLKTYVMYCFVKNNVTSIYHQVHQYLIVGIDMKKMATKFFALQTHLKINFNLTKAD